MSAPVGPAGDKTPRLTVVARFIVPYNAAPDGNGGIIGYADGVVEVEIPCPAVNGEVAVHRRERYLTSIEVQVDGKPVSRVPFSWHWDSRALHTICTANNPSVPPDVYVQEM